MDLTYTRRWLQNFTVTENRATSVADYTPFSVTARSIRGCRAAADTWSADCSMSSRPSPASRTTTGRMRPNYGTVYQVYNGVDLNVSARLRNGVQLQGGHEHRAARE